MCCGFLSFIMSGEKMTEKMNEKNEKRWNAIFHIEDELCWMGWEKSLVQKAIELAEKNGSLPAFAWGWFYSFNWIRRWWEF